MGILPMSEGLTQTHGQMPARFVDLDRQTPMFLPYDLREWSRP